MVSTVAYLHRSTNINVGEISVNVKYLSQECKLPLVVVQGYRPSLLGRDWSQLLSLDRKMIGMNTVDMISEVNQL